MPVVGTKAAASAQGFGEFAQASTTATYIEDVFSTWLYTGTGANQTFNTGIDLSTKGGMVWIKQRSSPAEDWRCVDSARGINYGLQQNLTNAQQDWTGLGYVTSFNTNGFSIGTNVSINTSAYTYASWTFRKQPKFFDVVTYTGNGVAGRTVAHSLGAAPGVIIIKRLNAASAWAIYHRSASAPLDFTTSAAGVQYSMASTFGNGTSGVAPTSSVFTLGTDVGVNANGDTYVAYLFAHNAGGFGLTGADNVISCGSYTGNGSTSGPVVTLGYEPQWLLVKRSDSSGDWLLFDVMRGLLASGDGNRILFPNLSSAEITGNTGYGIALTSTGFSLITDNGIVNANSATYIYIAIRRGPMKTPTSGTSVFSPITSSGGTGTVLTTGFPLDMQIARTRNAASQVGVVDRLRRTSTADVGTGTNISFVLNTTASDAEFSSTSNARYWDNAGFQMPSNWSGTNTIFWNFRRAPSVFDVVCWSGDEVAGRTVAHNLGATPELLIMKSRTNLDGWYVNAPNNTGLLLNATLSSNSAYQGASAVSSTTFTPISVNNTIGRTYVAYLFASCPGVSKVGSYTGNGTSQTIDCGFTGGARFFMVKRTNATGDWWIWDSARGIIASGDPAIALNSTAAETTGVDAVDPASVGIIVNQEATFNINVNGGTYIYLAIA